MSKQARATVPIAPPYLGLDEGLLEQDWDAFDTLGLMDELGPFDPVGEES